METSLAYLGLNLTAFLSGWGTGAVWKSGHRAAVFAALALVVAAALYAFHLASVATGGFLSGLAEALIGFGLLLGPGAGIVLGLVTAEWQQAGLVLCVLYALGLAALFGGIG